MMRSCSQGPASWSRKRKIRSAGLVFEQGAKDSFDLRAMVAHDLQQQRIAQLVVAGLSLNRERMAITRWTARPLTKLDRLERVCSISKNE